MKVLFMLLGVLLSSGCNAETTIVKSENEKLLSERFHASGISNDKVIRDFFDKIKLLVNTDNKSKLSEITLYPFKIYGLDGKGILDISNPNDFIKHYAAIFNERVVHTIKCETFSGLTGTAKGIIVGDGAIRFTQTKVRDEDPWVMKITRINNTPKDRKLWFKNEICK